MRGDERREDISNEERRVREEDRRRKKRSDKRRGGEMNIRGEKEGWRGEKGSNETRREEVGDEG